MINLATVRLDSKILLSQACFIFLNFVLFVLLQLSLCAQSFADDFRFTDTTGKIHNLQAYQGRWVVVNFWATWCPPCLEEIPEFAELYTARKNKDLMVLGIAVDIDDRKQVFGFAEKHGMNYPLVLGDETVTAQFGKIRVLPTTFLYDPNGKKVLHRVGPLNRADLEKLIGK